MTLSLAALVLCSFGPSPVVASATLAQGKVQIIKGKKGTVKAANASSEASPVPVVDAQGNNVNAAKSAELDRKSAELDAKNKDLSEREQALNEKQAAAAESDKKKAEQQKAQQKHIEKIGEQNNQMLQQASDSLAGD
jgi:Skp family chaperone for outer membrane proteins